MVRKIFCIGIISMLLLLGITSFSVAMIVKKAPVDQIASIMPGYAITKPEDPVIKPKLRIQVYLVRPTLTNASSEDLCSIIKIPSGSSFLVRVTTDSDAEYSAGGGKPVGKAEVTMTPLPIPTLSSIAYKILTSSSISCNRVYYTDEYGIAFIRAPFVRYDTMFKITASKKGYTSAEVDIVVTGLVIFRT